MKRRNCVLPGRITPLLTDPSDNKNPRLILLAEIRYRDAPKGFIPEDAPWWKRDADNKFVIGWAEGGYRLLDMAQPDWQAQAEHTVNTNDGIFFSETRRSGLVQQ